MKNYNAIFVCYESISIGFINPFSTPSTPNLDNTNFTERPSYVDFSTLKLKRGDQIYYNKRLRDSVTGEKQKQTTPTVIGVVNGEPTASRIVVDANVGQDVYDDFLNGGIKVYALRRKSTSGRKIYSYPIKNYIGACDYTNSIISLFFERTAGMIDEIRLDVTKGGAYQSIIAVNKAFSSESKGDIIFDNSGSTTGNNNIASVNKVISTIAQNRN